MKRILAAATAVLAIGMLLGACGDDDAGATPTKPAPVGTLQATTSATASAATTTVSATATPTVTTATPSPTSAPSATATTATVPAGPATVTATDDKYDTSQITATAGQPFTVTLANKGTAIHNLSFYTAKGGTLIDPKAEGGLLKPGATEQIAFTAPAAGTYYFQCDVHPDQMFGDFIVK